MDQIAKRDKELSKKTKSELWAILERKNKVMSRDKHYLKNWLISDIMRAEFGQRRITEFYS